MQSKLFSGLGARTLLAFGLVLGAMGVSRVTEARPCCSQCDEVWSACMADCAVDGRPPASCQAACDRGSHNCFANCLACAAPPAPDDGNIVAVNERDAGDPDACAADRTGGPLAAMFGLRSVEILR